MKKIILIFVSVALSPFDLSAMVLYRGRLVSPVSYEKILQQQAVELQEQKNALLELVALGKKAPTVVVTQPAFTNDSYKQVNFIDKVLGSFTKNCQDRDNLVRSNIERVTPRDPIKSLRILSVSPTSVRLEVVSPDEEEIIGKGLHASIPAGKNWARGAVMGSKSSKRSKPTDTDPKKWNKVSGSFGKCNGDRKKIKAKLARQAKFEAQQGSQLDTTQVSLSKRTNRFAAK